MDGMSLLLCEYRCHDISEVQFYSCVYKLSWILCPGLFHYSIKNFLLYRSILIGEIFEGIDSLKIFIVGQWYNYYKQAAWNN